jgi:pilus biogenesis lipoprotein CpaD
MTLANSSAVRAPIKIPLVAIGIAVLALVLAGCGTTAPPGAPPGTDLGDYTAAPRDLIGVTSVADSHVVRPGRAGYVGKPERDRLDAFIADVAANRPESLHVSLHGRATPVQLNAVANLLVADGVDPKHILLADWRIGPPVPGGTIVVAIERAIAMQPNCPGWVDHVSAPEDNHTNPNLGCSDVTNFAAMVGDPHHLSEGASSIYTDGEVAATSVAEYRTNTVVEKWKDLPQLSRSNIGVSQ